MSPASGPAIEYAKAVETELNALVFPALREALRTRPPAEREVSVDGRTLDLGGTLPHQTLGTLKNLLQHNGVVRGQLPVALSQGRRLAVLPSRGPAWLVGAAPQPGGSRRADLARCRE